MPRPSCVTLLGPILAGSAGAPGHASFRTCQGHIAAKDSSTASGYVYQRGLASRCRCRVLTCHDHAPVLYHLSRRRSAHRVREEEAAAGEVKTVSSILAAEVSMLFVSRRSGSRYNVAIS